MLALNCGKTFSAEAQTFSAMAVTVIFPPASSARGRKAGAQLLEFRDVGVVLLRNMRDRIPCFPHMLRSLAPHSTNGNALNLSPFAEVREHWLGHVRGRRWRGGRGQPRLGAGLHIVFADAAARPSAFDLVDVHADFPRQPPDRWRRRHGLAVFCARNLAQLCGHGKRARNRCGLIGRERLFFRFSFCPDRRLERQTSPGLSRDVLHRVMPDVVPAPPLPLPGKDQLPDFDLLALFDFDLFHYSAHRRRNFDHRFVGFQFHHRLTF